MQFSDPPEFQNVVETINVRLNEPSTISCDATGMPQPAMNLSFRSNILQAVTTSTSNLSSLIYKINKTSVDDLGEYTCTASSRLNNIQATITLNGECCTYSGGWNLQNTERDFCQLGWR